MIYYERDKVMIRTAVESDIMRMKDRIRPADIEEVKASHGHGAEEALRYSYKLSTRFCLTIVLKGLPVAMFGVAPDPRVPHAGTVWLLGTVQLSEMWLTFLRLSRGFINQMLNLYPTLYNFVDARNVASIEWLKWCGAEFHPPESYGEAGIPFCFFMIKKGVESCAAQH